MTYFMLLLLDGEDEKDKINVIPSIFMNF
jgi:hypothetical protein